MLFSVWYLGGSVISSHHHLENNLFIGDTWANFRAFKANWLTCIHPFILFSPNTGHLVFYNPSDKRTNNINELKAKILL